MSEQMTRDRFLLNLAGISILCGVGFVLTVDWGIAVSPAITASTWFVGWAFFWTLGAYIAFSQYRGASGAAG